MKQFCAIAFVLPFGLMAQSPQVLLDTAIIRIGEQATLTLSIEQRSDVPRAAVQWPAIGDTLVKRVEVVRRTAVDTLQVEPQLDPNAFRIEQKLTITSFDSGFWAIPPFRFVIDGRAVETEPLLLEVRSVELDSALAIRDIRNIIEPPFNVLFWIQDHAWWVGGSIALAVLAALLWLYFKTRVKDPKEPLRTEPEVPIHERILADLRALEAERLWQQGMHKAYHSRLTDLLRTYIEERYKVPALERTSDELLHELRVSPLTVDQQTQLGNMLRLADLVKFAKATPTPAENEQMMVGAIRFVEATRPSATNPGSHA